MSFTKLFMYAGYEMNKDYIAKVLCENKANPRMHCNGKCYLSKKIKQVEESNQKQQQRFSKHFFVEVYQISGQKFKCYTQQIAECNSPYLNAFPEKNVKGIFHPPKA